MSRYVKNLGETSLLTKTKLEIPSGVIFFRKIAFLSLPRSAFCQLSAAYKGKGSMIFEAVAITKV